MPKTRSFQLEVCVDRIDDALAVVDAGATRIELNHALALDGLTPSLAACEFLAGNCEVDTIAMLRPHDRGFFYSSSEQDCLLRDCNLLLSTGIAGIAFGSVAADGSLDFEFLSRIAELCGDRQLVLHRAFDTLSDQLEAVESLSRLGVQRILTSGGAQTAEQGSAQLGRLQRVAGSDLEIMPGAGIHSKNLRELAAATKCHSFHGSFSMGGDHPDIAEIRAARQILEELEAQSIQDSEIQ